MAKAHPAPNPQHDVLFGFEQGGFVDTVKIVPWQELEGRRLQREAAIPSVGELASRQLVQIGTTGRRNRFLEKFKGSWVPFHQQEVTFAMKTLPCAVSHASKGYGGGAAAVGSSLKEAEKYLKEAATAVHTLEEALISEDDKEPLPGQVRSSETVKGVLAEYLLAKNYFDIYDWPPRKRNPEKPNRKTDALLQKIKDQIGNTAILDDSRLVELWKQAHGSQQNRRTYWSGQLRAVADIDIVRAALNRR